MPTEEKSFRDQLAEHDAIAKNESLPPDVREHHRAQAAAKRAAAAAKRDDQQTTGNRETTGNR
jgi:hypothetical protein